MRDWNNTVTGLEINPIKRERMLPFIVYKAKEKELPQLADEGWIKHKEYKSGGALLHKDKSELDLYTDRLWVLFANMGFMELNKEKEILIPYDEFDNTYAVSVFAADGETVLIIDVKYNKSKEQGSLAQDLDFFRKHVGELTRSIRSKYPKAKIKFIWATHNLIMQRADLDQMAALRIAHFDDSALAYYFELVKHLGTAAKYQLLGNLFAKMEIANMDNRIPAIQGKMGGYTYYSFSIEPEKLLKIGYVLHRNEANAAMMPTYQRLIKKKRLQEVREFVNNGGYFPNSIIISIDSGGKGVVFEPVGKKEESTISKIGILYMPKRYHSAYIIDGQHRLYGYSGSKYAMTNTIPVVAFVDLDRAEQVKLFMDINENQKAVPKTLRVTLNADMLWDSDDKNEQRQALRSKIAQMLGENSTSPLKGRILVGEGEQSILRAVSVEAVQKALLKTSFFSNYDKKNNVVKQGTFDCENNEATCDLFYPFLESFMQYFQTNCNAEWEREDGDGIIVINRSIFGLIKILDDIVNMLLHKGMLFPHEQSADDMMQLVSYYISPLVDYFNKLSLDSKKELKSYMGEGGNTRFWRTFQKVINEKRKDFYPEGMEDYWLNESKTYNQVSYEYIVAISKKLKNIIQDNLEKEFGGEWLEKGIPIDVYRKIIKLAKEAVYEAVNNNEEIEEKSPWEYVSLTDCKAIILNGKNWSTLFSNILTRPEDKAITGNREVKTKWIADVADISHKLCGKNYSVSVEQHAFLSSVHDWIANLLVL